MERLLKLRISDRNLCSVPAVPITYILKELLDCSYLTYRQMGSSNDVLLNDKMWDAKTNNVEILKGSKCKMAKGRKRQNLAIKKC